jgi:hypothetical protein
MKEGVVMVLAGYGSIFPAGTGVEERLTRVTNFSSKGSFLSCDVLYERRFAGTTFCFFNFKKV